MDVTKTLTNLGAATKSAFEHERAPMYHVQNMAGSAKDALMAAMKIPTQEFLLPTSYQIVLNRHDDKLGDISPELFSEKSTILGNDNLPIFTSPDIGFGNTFQKVIWW